MFLTLTTNRFHASDFNQQFKTLWSFHQRRNCLCTASANRLQLACTGRVFIIDFI